MKDEKERLKTAHADGEGAGQSTSLHPSSHIPHPSRKRRKRRRRRAGNYYLKIAVTVVGGMAAAGVLFLFLSKVVHPYRLGYQVGQDVAEQREKLERQKQINAQLRARVAYLKSDEGMEREARSAGFHRPGEMVYLMPAEPVKDAGTDEAAASAPDAAPNEKEP